MYLIFVGVLYFVAVVIVIEEDVVKDFIVTSCAQSGVARTIVVDVGVAPY